MKRTVLRNLFAALLVVATLPLMAQESTFSSEPSSEVTKKSSTVRREQRILRKEQYKSQPKVTTEFGLGAGVRYNMLYMESLTNGFSPNMSMQWGGGGALQFRLNIGRSFGFQPEISYSHSVLKISGMHNENRYSTKIKSNIVQIPMLLSFRLWMFRFNAGPVFTLMDNANYQLPTADDNIKQMTIGRIYPTITYAAGISAKLSKRMMLDVRYADQFPGKSGNKVVNEYIWTLDESKQSEAFRFRTRNRSVQLRLSVVF